jgi:hypothetical protein
MELRRATVLAAFGGFAVAHSAGPGGTTPLEPPGAALAGRAGQA